MAQARGEPMPAEDADRAKDDAVARKEILYVFLAVVGTLLLISFVMVSRPSVLF